MNNYVKYTINGVIVSLAALFCYSCNQNDNNVPTVAVNEYLNLNLPEFNNLNAVNNWIYYNQAGNRGMIIIRTGPGPNDFMAYDRTCTYDPNVSSAVIEGLPNDIFAIDSTCISKFNLIDGSVASGPASQPLMRYRTELLSNNVLHIFN